jgi:hypothetical protein
MARADVQAFLDDSNGAGDKVPTLMGQATQHFEEGMISVPANTLVVMYPIGSLKENHVLRTKKGSFGFSLGIDPYTLQLQRSDGTYGGYRIEPMWKGQWCTISGTVG